MEYLSDIVFPREANLDREVLIYVRSNRWTSNVFLGNLRLAFTFEVGSLNQKSSYSIRPFGRHWYITVFSLLL